MEKILKKNMIFLWNGAWITQAGYSLDSWQFWVFVVGAVLLVQVHTKAILRG